MKKILFIGYGNMGAALGEAWRARSEGARVLAIDPAFATRPAAHGFASAQALADAGEGGAFDLIVLAVKPAMAADALRALPHPWMQGAVLLSIAAGVRLASLRAAAPAGLRLVRAMPNTPALLGLGCTGLFAEADVDEAAREQLGALLRHVGSVHWLQAEAQIDQVTAISGSGPAYYHLFSEALAQAGQALGLPAELARALAAGTAAGAAAQQGAPGADFAALRRAVTSPNGTTAAAIAVFEQDEALRQLVLKAAQAAHRRAIELSSAA
ncbi:pyrroline-5-carboxylate reductase [Xenophilus arseniciresistens]|uniref:Pyrroline-5-carboxylate reductase n=1 Tax=Xenophilus arseniciresistens TaxID=1283306 RepID=A0AAE3NC35_9BURK|nr:pyrroline-5-carboxylate reductase [Xenophilus arseniciresistens]MDA7418673.1 pyrroline-5-carboxylate reductase [Xenophilus arseniciresistens]